MGQLGGPTDLDPPEEAGAMIGDTLPPAANIGRRRHQTKDGRTIDVDSPEGLVARHCPERTVVLDTEHATAKEFFQKISGVVSVTRIDNRFTISGRSDDFVSEVIHCLSENRIRVTDFRTVLPNLEDVFLKLTGHSIRE